MVKGLEIMGKPISCTNREGSDKIKDIHYQINDIIFQWGYKYMTPIDAHFVYNQLCELGKQLKDLEVPDRAQAKKDEILIKLRGICTNLKTYHDTYRLGSQEDVQQAMSTTKYLVSTYLKDRQNKALTPQRIVELLEEHKRIRTNMLQPLSQLYNVSYNTSFTNMPEELINTLRCMYQPGYVEEKYGR